jgi:sodium-dependent dicarboxylate transporter 2/3/5
MSVNAPTVQNAGSEKKMEKKMDKKIATWRYVLAVCGAIGFALIAAYAPASFGLTQAGKTMLGILFFLLTWWIAEICSFLVTGFVGMLLMLLFQVADMPTIFSGFSNNIFIFMIFAFTIAVAVTKTGLGKRIAYAVIARSKPTYTGIMVTFVLIGVLLAAVIPLANACVVVLGTIGLMILPVFGQTEDTKSNVGRGLFTMLGLSTLNSANCYLTGVGAILVVGILAKGGYTLNYLQWLTMFLPVSLIVSIIVAVIIPRLFPPEVKKISVDKYKEFQETLHGLGPMSVEEKKAAIVVSITIFLWIIGSFIKLNLITVGVLGGVLLMFPFIGTVTADDFSKKIPWPAVFFTGFCLTLGAVLQATKLTGFLVKISSPVMVSSSLLVFCLKLALLSMVVHILIPAPLAVLATFVPVIMASAKAQNFSVITAVVVFIMASNAAIMVYQKTQTVIAFGFKQFDTQDLLKPGLVTAALWLLMTPLVVLYLTAIGL